MRFTTEEEPDRTLPEDSIHRARLEEITLRTFTWYKDGVPTEGKTLDWWWQITSTKLGPDYIGRRVKAECKPALTNRGDNRFRIWAEALLHREVPVGMAIDTDDLVGLEAEIVIGHRDDRKDSNKKWEFVSDVIPLAEGLQSDEPPF